MSEMSKYELFRLLLILLVILGLIGILGYRSYSRSFSDLSNVPVKSITGTVIGYSTGGAGKGAGMDNFLVKLDNGIRIDVPNYPSNIIPPNYRGELAIIYQQESAFSVPIYRFDQEKMKLKLNENK